MSRYNSHTGNFQPLPTGLLDKVTRRTVTAFTLSDLRKGIALFDLADRLVYDTAQFTAPYGLAPERLRWGTAVDAVWETRLSSGIFEIDPENKASLVDERRVRHRPANGRPTQISLADGRWLKERAVRTPDGGYMVIGPGITRRHRAARILVGNGQRCVSWRNGPAMRLSAANSAGTTL